MFKDTQHLNPAAYLILSARTSEALGNIFVSNRGDVNGDENITVTDVLFALTIMINNSEYVPQADMDFNGKIELLDIVKILKTAVE